MSYRDLIDVHRHRGNVQTSEGAAKGAGYAAAGQGLARGVYKGLDRMDRSDAREAAMEHDRDMQRRQFEQQNSMQSRRFYDAQALEMGRESRADARSSRDARAAAEALRRNQPASPSAAAGGAAVGGSTARDAAGMIPGFGSVMDAQGGPSAQTMPGPTGLEGLGSFDQVMKVNDAIVEDRERRRAQAERDKGNLAATNALRALRGGSAANPLGAVDPADLVTAGRAGFGPMIRGAAGARRQAEYVDPRVRAESNAAAQREVYKTGSQVGLNNARAALLNAQAGQVGQAQAPSLDSVRLALAAMSGPERVALERLFTPYAEAFKAMSDPMATAESRAAAQSTINSLGPFITQLLGRQQQMMQGLRDRTGGTQLPPLTMPGAPQSGPPVPGGTGGGDDESVLGEAGWLPR